MQTAARATNSWASRTSSASKAWARVNRTEDRHAERRSSREHRHQQPGAHGVVADRLRPGGIDGLEFDQELLARQQARLTGGQGSGRRGAGRGREAVHVARHDDGRARAAGQHRRRGAAQERRLRDRPRRRFLAAHHRGEEIDVTEVGEPRHGHVRQLLGRPQHVQGAADPRAGLVDQVEPFPGPDLGGEVEDHVRQSHHVAVGAAQGQDRLRPDRVPVRVAGVASAHLAADHRPARGEHQPLARLEGVEVEQPRGRQLPHGVPDEVLGEALRADPGVVAGQEAQVRVEDVDDERRLGEQAAQQCAEHVVPAHRLGVLRLQQPPVRRQGMPPQHHPDGQALPVPQQQRAQEDRTLGAHEAGEAGAVGAGPQEAGYRAAGLGGRPSEQALRAGGPIRHGAPGVHDGEGVASGPGETVRGVGEQHAARAHPSRPLGPGTREDFHRPILPAVKI